MRTIRRWQVYNTLHRPEVSNRTDSILWHNLYSAGGRPARPSNHACYEGIDQQQRFHACLDFHVKLRSEIAVDGAQWWMRNDIPSCIILNSCDI